MSFSRKKYKVGDRIFYECTYDNKIQSDIVLEVEDSVYQTDKGKEIKYQWLTVWREGNCSEGIENYNCLSPKDPKCAELAKAYAKFDKQKDKIIDSIMSIMAPWDQEVQRDIIKLLKIKTNYDD